MIPDSGNKNSDVDTARWFTVNFTKQGISSKGWRPEKFSPSDYRRFLQCLNPDNVLYVR